MKLFLVMYGGPSPDRLAEILERQGLHDYTTFAGGHGSGRTGKREGSRAWPGETTMALSVVPTEVADTVASALAREAEALPAGERLHVAILPTERFF